jgi:hypothetical protein
VKTHQNHNTSRSSLKVDTHLKAGVVIKPQHNRWAVKVKSGVKSWAWNNHSRRVIVLGQR